jgi:hypothetical protein
MKDFELTITSEDKKTTTNIKLAAPYNGKKITCMEDIDYQILEDLFIAFVQAQDQISIQIDMIMKKIGVERLMELRNELEKSV